jgi:hypothetical protein
MIRSGSTLQFQIASELVERHGMGRRVEYVPESEFQALAARHGNSPGFKVFKAHQCTPDLAELCREHALAIYSYRDLRDVAVSAMRKFGFSFNQLLENRWLDQAVADGERWVRVPRVLVTRYEDLVLDLSLEVRRIAEFIGIELLPMEDKEIARDLSMDKQRARIADAMPDLAGTAPASLIAYDPTSLLHHNHIHEGEVGGWRALPADDLRELENRFGQWLVTHGYLLSDQ